MDKRFLTLAEVAEILNISLDQSRVLVRNGELRALRVGARGQWRVGESDLEDFIERGYRRTEQAIRADGLSSPAAGE